MIETENLKMVACTGMHLNSLERNHAVPSLMGADTAEGWLVFPESVEYATKLLQSHSQNLRWGMHLILHKGDNKIIGTSGYNGMANDDGLVEMGYALAPSYRNVGIEAEIAKGLVDNAFRWAAVIMIDTYTVARSNESSQTLKDLGFSKMAREGDLLQWRLTRGDYEGSQAE